MSKKTPKFFVQVVNKSVFGLLLLIGSIQSSFAQNTCSQLNVEYTASQSSYVIGIINTSPDQLQWKAVIEDAHYMLDGTLFSNADGVTLTVNTSPNLDGTYDHELIPDKFIEPYQNLNFVYNGSPIAANNNYQVSTDIKCANPSSSICSALKFEFFRESQSGFGFSVVNNSADTIYPYEIHVDNATYQFDLSQLQHSGFSVSEIDNANGTYDYYFIALDPIYPGINSSIVKTTQDLGAGATSDGASIYCSNDVVSSGNNGGLESHGGLASKIALRNFRRAVGKETASIINRNNSVLSKLAPQHILEGDNLIETSPTDLVDITAAESIWAGDYFIDDMRFGSVFGSKTSDVIYDHTKVICDRVKGSELETVEVVNIGGYEMILSIIRRPNNSVEYAISFSLAYENFGDFTMASNWAKDEYISSPNFLNYQVWTNSKAKSITAVKHIIDNIIEENGYKLNPADVSPVAPKLFARKAYYKLGAFYIELSNQLSESTAVQFSGTCNTKEIDGEQVIFNKEFEISPGQSTIALNVPHGNIFDAEISLRSEDNQKDVIYLADGSWGLEYQDHSTSIDKYEIISEERSLNREEYIVERGISVSGSTDTYVSIFKQLVPGGAAVDLSEYNTMSFDSKREGVYEVTLLMEGNTDPSKNLSYTLDAEASSTVDIPLILFSNAHGVQLDASKITTIYIAFTVANNERNDFEFTIENVRFRNDKDSDFNVDPTKLSIYPNPTNGKIYVTHSSSEKSDVTITVRDLKGSVVKKLNGTAYKGLQHFEVNLDDVKQQGVYIISLQSKEGVFSSSLQLVR